MREVATALHAATGLRDKPEGSDDPPPTSEDLDTLLRRALTAGAAQRALILVDQLEELFTLCQAEAERADFISWLGRVANGSSADGPLALVACGLRADFYGECARYPQLRHALMADQVLVGPMSPGQLREAVVYPARATGLEIKAGLAEILLRDLGAIPEDDAGVRGGYDTGRLPLLAHALRTAWQQRHGDMLTVDGYRATGGIRRAVATTAEQAFSQLDPEARQEAQAVFLRMVRIGDAGEDTRRRISREELLRDSHRPAQAQSALDAFTESRLLTQDRDAVEITHEALIRGWPRLRQWIDQDRAGHLVRQDLTEAASAWDRGRRDPAGLYRGGLLDTAQSWADSHGSEITPVVRDFLAASRRFKRRAIVLRRAAVAGLAILTAASGITAGLAINAESNAVIARNQAIVGQVTAEAGQLTAANPALAAQLNPVANRMKTTRDSMTRILSAAASPLPTLLAIPAGAVSSIAFSSDGHTLATSSRRRQDLVVEHEEPGPSCPAMIVCPSAHGALEPIHWFRDRRAEREWSQER